MSAPSRPLLVVTAMPEELEPILEGAGSPRRERGGFFRARIGATDAVLAATGDGAARAAAGIARLFDAALPTALLGVGVAGALSFDLAAGELLAGRSVRDAAGEAPPPHPSLLARALSGGARVGTLIALERPAVTANEKRALATTVDGSAPAAADMESAAWARAAASRGVPYLVVRAIADAADEELPDYIAQAVGPDGGIRRGDVVRRALARPSTIPTLVKMRNRVRFCGEKLARFVYRFLAEPIDL